MVQFFYHVPSVFLILDSFFETIRGFNNFFFLREILKPHFFTKTGQKLVFLTKKKPKKIMKLGKRVTEFHKNCNLLKKL